MSGLSCYTANVAGYLRRLSPDADRLVARSIRLAIADQDGGLLAFSHHAWPLNALPWGGALGYRAATGRDAALEGVAAELAATGAVLVVADGARLPWAPAGAPPAPHFVLLDGRAAGCWHAVDEFSALGPGGLQHEPFTGWIPDSALLRMIEPGPPPRPEQRLRNRLAFGAPLPLPPDRTFQWLGVGVQTARPLPAGWTVDPAAALDMLAQRLAAAIGDDRLLDDVWAATQHHVHRYEVVEPQLGARAAAAADAWRALPRTLRFAAISARRGRPRASLVEAALAGLREIEAQLREPLRALGFGAEAEVNIR
ncbi:MAG TPA: hypothetical protein VFM37_15905 [Pseudonocardiaceae bacterium]|nr:hypothetical protein [Pseudonocardiaceae bacterium]